jgi:hypothetical protein
LARSRKYRSPGRSNPSSFAYLQGNLITLTNNTSRLAILKGVLDFETDIANIKSEWIVPALLNMINDKVISKWNADQLDNYADLVCYGAQLLAELKPQVVIKELVPGITRSDAGGFAVPFTRSTWNGILASIDQIKIPPMSFALVNFFDKVVQICGAEYDAGQLASYLYPFANLKSAAEVETLLNTINGLYDAAVYATQSGQMLVGIDGGWLNSINEVSILSQWGCTLARYIPVNYDNGGAETETEEAFDADTDLYVSQILGVPEYGDAFAILRGTSGAPYVYTVQSIANDKVSVYYAALPNTTSFTELGKAEAAYDWIKHMADARSVNHAGMYSWYHGTVAMARKDNILVSATAWDRRMANWLSKHSVDPGVPEVSLPVLPDIIGSVRRGNPVTTGGVDPPRTMWDSNPEKARVHASGRAGKQQSLEERYLR